MPKIGAFEIIADVDIGDVDVYQIAGVVPQLDDTDKLAVSVYGKSTVAGDTPIPTHSTYGLRVSPYSAGTTPADALPTTLQAPRDHSGFVLEYMVYQWLFNGDTYDRARSNVFAQLAASAARTATLTTADQINYNHKGIILIVDVTARAAACTLTPSIEVKGPTGTVYHKIFEVAAAIDTADGTVAYLLYPTTPDAGSLYTEECNIAIPRTFRVVITHSTANSITYSLDLYYLL